MKCDVINLGPGATAFVCGRPQKPEKPCSVAGCRRASRFLCDFPLTGAAAGKLCSRALCDVHRFARRPGIDYCPVHAKVVTEPAAVP